MKQIRLLLIPVLFLLFLPAVHSGSAIIGESQLLNNLMNTAGTGLLRYQSFIPTKTGFLTNISLYMDNEGTPVETANLTIWTLDGGDDLNVLQCQFKDILPAQVTTERWLNISPTANCVLTQGTTYAFVVWGEYQADINTFKFGQQDDDGSAYSDGVAASCVGDFTCVFGLTPNRDFKFITLYNSTDREPPLPDATLISINVTNVTSEGGLGQLVNISDPFCRGTGCHLPRTNDTTLTLRATSNASAIAALIDHGIRLNYSDMIIYNSASECSTTGGIEHTCTLTSDNATNRTGVHNFCIGAKNADNFENLSCAFEFAVNITDPIKPNTTLLTPADDASFILGINNTNINFNFTATDNIDRNFTTKLYIDDVLKVTNSTYLNGTNVSYLFDETVFGTHTWYVDSTDSYGNINQSETRSFVIKKTANITIFLDGQNNTRRYEYPVRRTIGGAIVVTARVVNITIIIDENVRTCITIDDQVNLSCNIGNWSYLFNVTELKQDRIFNGSLRVNMSQGINNISIDADNLSDVLFFTVNITGYELLSQYPEGIEIDVDKDGKSEVVLPGKLRGNIVETNTFLADNLNRSRYNVSFQTGGSTTILINVTSEENLINFSMEVSGSDLDAENEFSYAENFSGKGVGFNDTLSYQTDAPMGIFDDFVTNVSGRWDAGLCGLTYQSNGLHMVCGASNIELLSYSDEAADLRNSSIVGLFYEWSGSCGAGGGSVGNFLYATDGTSKVTLFPVSKFVGVGSSSDKYNVTLEKTVFDDTTWRVIVNGISKGNYDLSSLNFNNHISLIWQPISGGVCSVSMVLNNFTLSGAWLNRSTNNGIYKSTGNITSNVLTVTEKNISRAIITSAIDYKPANTDIDYYLSNTCNYTNPIFESATPGIIHTFNTIGNELCWRATLNSSVNITSPIIRKLIVEIIKGLLVNVSADFGSDGDTDWFYNGVLNSTTSPKVVNGTLEDLNTYRRENCLGSLVCEYPITLSSLTGGTLEIAKVNTTVKVSDIDFNISKVQNKSIVNMSFIFKKGLLELSGINLNFMGQKNFTINATHNVSDTILEDKDSQIVWFRNSKFNWSLPYTFTRDIVPYGIRTVNSTNVTPFGQTAVIPIINISNLAQNAFNIGLKINQTFSCLEIKALNSSNKNQIKDYGINLTNSIQNFAGNITKGKSQGIWLFYDLYNCNPSTMRFLRPKIEYESCCRQCISCWN